jgi:methionyl-tRNA synthetase
MLMALGEPLPKQVFGHPWLLTGSDKMSKSKGNVIYADDLVKMFGVDAVRFLMLHEMPFAQDGHITYELMIERINSDLANNLGNLVNRTISMQNKYFNGTIANPDLREDVDDKLRLFAMNTVSSVQEKMEELRVADAIDDILDLFDRCNKYIDETMPWALAKDPDKISRLATVLYNLLEAIRIGAVLLAPFLPDTSEKILDQISTQKRDYDSIAEFGGLETRISVTSAPEILFRRLDEKEVMAEVEKIQKEQEARIREQKKKAEKKAPIKLSDFQKVELKTGKVLKCEKHPDAEKLLVLQVDLGDGDVRQIVSGIAASYTPGQMCGKTIIVITNLEPTVIRGVESQGMLLAGGSGSEIAVAEVNGLVPGTTIS